MRSLSSSSLTNIQRHGFRLGQQNNGDLKERAKSAAFKFLSALVKENNHVKLAVFDQLVEFLQLLSICFIGPWGPLGDKIFHVLIWSQVETVFLEYHIPALSAAMVGVSLAFVAVVVILSLYSFRSFLKNDFWLGMWPLNLLRKLASLLCGVLFLPVSAPLLMALACGIMDYPGQCNVTGAIPLLAVSAVGVTIFVPFCLFLSLTYFNPNSKSRSFIGRPNAHLQLLDTVVKLVLICLFTFARAYPLPFAITQTVCYIAISSYIFIYLPYYNERVTFFRFVLASILLWSSIMTTVVASLNNKNNDVIYVATWISIVPLVGYISLRIIQNKHHKTTLGLYEQVMKIQKLKEQTKDLSFGAVELIYGQKFSSPLSVELSTRFLHKHHGPLDLLIADAIFERGVELFSNRCSMFIFAGIFRGIWMGRIALWKQALKSAEGTKRHLIDSLTLHEQVGEVKSMEESMLTGKNMNVVESLELFHLLKRLKKTHNQARVQILCFWKILSSQKVDIMALQVAVGKISALEKSGTELCAKLLKLYPYDGRVHTACLKFQNEIAQDFRTSWLLQEAIEEAKSKKEEIHDPASLNALNMSNSPSPVAIRRNFQKPGKRDMENDSGSDVDSSMNSNKKPESSFSSSRNNHSQFRDISEAFTPSKLRNTKWSGKEIRQYVRYRDQLNALRPITDHKSKLFVNIVMVFLCVLAIAESIWVVFTINNVKETVLLIRDAGVRRDISIDFADGVLDAKYSIQGGPDTMEKDVGPDDYESYKRTLEEQRQRLADFSEAQQKLYLHEDMNGQFFYMWNDESRSGFSNLAEYNPAIDKWHHISMGMFDAGYLFVLHGNESLLISPEEYKAGLHRTNPEYRFVKDNFPFTMLDAFNDATAKYISEASSNIDNVLQTLMASFGGVCFLLIIIGFFVFRPLLNNMISARRQSLDILLSIPKELSIKMYSKILLYQKDGSKKVRVTETITEEDEEGEENEDSDDDDDFDITIDISKRSELNTINKMHSRLTMAYIGGLLLITFLFGIAIGSNYIVAVPLKEYGNRLDIAHQIRTFSHRIAFIFRELAVKQFKLYRDPAFDNPELSDDDVYRFKLKYYLDRDISVVERIRADFLYGNSSPHDHLDPELEHAVFSPLYFAGGSMMSADRLVSNLLADSKNVMSFIDIRGVNSSDIYFYRVRLFHDYVLEAWEHIADVSEDLFNKSVQTWKNIVLGLMGATIAGAFVVYLMIFRKLLTHLQTTSVESSKMLLLLPPDISRPNWLLQVYIRGKDGAKIFFKENGWKITDSGDDSNDQIGSVMTKGRSQEPFLIAESKNLSKSDQLTKVEDSGSSQPEIRSSAILENDYDFPSRAPSDDAA